jgi:hypothetical protein
MSAHSPEPQPIHHSPEDGAEQQAVEKLPSLWFGNFEQLKAATTDVLHRIEELNAKGGSLSPTEKSELKACFQWVIKFFERSQAQVALVALQYVDNDPSYALAQLQTIWLRFFPPETKFDDIKSQKARVALFKRFVGTYLSLHNMKTWAERGMDSAQSVLKKMGDRIKNPFIGLQTVAPPPSPPTHSPDAVHSSVATSPLTTPEADTAEVSFEDLKPRLCSKSRKATELTPHLLASEPKTLQALQEACAELLPKGVGKDVSKRNAFFAQRLPDFIAAATNLEKTKIVNESAANILVGGDASILLALACTVQHLPQVFQELKNAAPQLSVVGSTEELSAALEFVYGKKVTEMPDGSAIEMLAKELKEKKILDRIKGIVAKLTQNTASFMMLNHRDTMFPQSFRAGMGYISSVFTSIGETRMEYDDKALSAHIAAVLCIYNQGDQTKYKSLSSELKKQYGWDIIEQYAKKLMSL